MHEYVKFNNDPVADASLVRRRIASGRAGVARTACGGRFIEHPFDIFNIARLVAGFKTSESPTHLDYGTNDAPSHRQEPVREENSR